MSRAIQTPKKSKRKLDDADLSDERKPQQPRVSNHKRSSTVGDSIMSAPPHRHRRFRHGSSIDVTRLGDGNGSLLANTLMHQARRLASSTRLDTTQTDYFKLKAMGIDPDTPVVPQTKKRALDTSELNGASKVPKTRPDAAEATLEKLPSSNSTPRKANSGGINTEDDDDAFFASIRTLRETLADSTSWFQSERETIERSMTPTAQSLADSSDSAKTETVAERRLREIRENPHTPSRSEIRLRAIGDKALLPAGFWDGEGMGQSLFGTGKGKEREKQDGLQLQQMPNGNPPPPAPPMGFAALARQGYTMGSANGNGFGQNNAQQQPEQSGASAEDAIEL